jgi:hypothetical protein
LFSLSGMQVHKRPQDVDCRTHRRRMPGVQQAVGKARGPAWTIHRLQWISILPVCARRRQCQNRRWCPAGGATRKLPRLRQTVGQQARASRTLCGMHRLSELHVHQIQRAGCRVFRRRRWRANRRRLPRVRQTPGYTARQIRTVCELLRLSQLQIPAAQEGCRGLIERVLSRRLLRTCATFSDRF